MNTLHPTRTQSAAPPLIQPESGLSLRKLTESLQAALDIHRSEAREKLATGKGLPDIWREALAQKAVDLQIEHEDLDVIVQKVRAVLEADLDEDDLDRITAFGNRSWNTFTFIRAVPYKDGIYAIHESTSKSVPGYMDLSGTEEGPWEFEVYEYERCGQMAEYSEGCLKIVSKVVDGECQYDAGLDRSVAIEIQHISDVMEKTIGESREQDYWPLWSGGQSAHLLSLPTSTSAQCIDMLDELAKKHQLTYRTKAENLHVQTAISSLHAEMDRVNSQIRELESHRNTLRDSITQAETRHQLTYFGLDEGSLVVHVDEPDTTYVIKLVPNSSHQHDWIPALYPAQSQGAVEGQSVDQDAAKRGARFFGELRLGEWTRIDAEQADEDEADGVDEPSP